MTKIKDYIEQNENIIIRISEVASTDPCECLSRRIYEGEVIQEGWLLGAQINQLSILSIGDKL